MKKRPGLFLLLIVAGYLCSNTGCSPANQLKRSATTHLLALPELQTAHIGIAVFDPVSAKFLYQHNSNKYFVPASNTKIFSCYAAMRLLGDSLEGIRYSKENNEVVLIPTGDPTLLHPDFKTQPVFQFLKNTVLPIKITTTNWNEVALGRGWSWDDYSYSYMTERSPLPVYGNLIEWIQQRDTTEANSTPAVFSVPEVNWPVKFNATTTATSFDVERNKNENVFTITEGAEPNATVFVPFITNGLQAALELLKDTLGKTIEPVERKPARSAYEIIYSHPLDSLLKPMMHNSDNFFAEQVLLMAAARHMPRMNTAALIDSLLRTDLKDLPQKPRWVDGSGLSRYNLFTPQDFVWILNKMKQQFSWQRITTIFPTGNEGTLANYYANNAGKIFMKTGTLSGQLALSGYVITNKNKVLIVSFLINNHQTSTTLIRRNIEKVLIAIMKTY